MSLFKRTWKKEHSRWYTHYKCHCETIYTKVTTSHISIYKFESKEAPEAGFVCPSCGCHDSYLPETGRYEWESSRTKIRNKHWVKWVVCSPENV